MTLQGNGRGSCSLYVGLEGQHVLPKQIQSKKFLVRQQYLHIQR